MRIQKVSQAWYGMIMSGGLVLLLAILMLCPIVPDGASAARDPACAQEPGSELCCAVSPNDVSCAGSGSTAEPSISLALAARTEINIVPVPKGEFNAGTASLKVAVNNATSQEVEGYKIYLKTETSNNSLTGATLTDRSIQSITANTTKASFPNNTWGYSLNRVGTATADTATYSPVPTTSTIIDDSTLLAGDYDLIFATKVDTATAPDQYSTALVVSAIAEPKVVAGLLTITNMQEMTSAICAGSSEGDTKQLVDTRDGNKYYVAKMKDGNCWMTQNLALDLSTSKTLTSADTDVSSSYTPKSNTKTTTTSGATSAGQSWSLDNAYSETGDMHALYGNYYTWSAATAGTGDSLATDGKSATGSICPKGWQLPTGGSSGKFQALAKSYSITNDTAGSTTLQGDPLYFVMAGRINPSSGKLESVGSYGQYQSSTVHSTVTAYILGFSASTVNPANYYGCLFGQSVRCVAR